MKDRYNRTIDYMRISITDRCNLRCTYCMPQDISLTSMENILTYEEILRICAAAAELGITRFKVTGGEPLVKKNILAICEKTAAVEGIARHFNRYIFHANKKVRFDLAVLGTDACIYGAFKHLLDHQSKEKT